MNKQLIFIMTDTTRKDMLGCYNPDMHTPNLDALAEEGLKFENTYSCQPVCGPARSAIFTGQFPHSNGMYTNSIAMGDNVKTVGQRLTDNGIHCGYIGKYHLDGADYFGLGRCPEGWDPEYWYDMRTYLEELTDEQRMASRKPESSYEDWMTEDFTYAHRCTDRAVKFLEKNKETDFFLTISYDEPHGPCLCPAPFNRMYEGYSFDYNPNYDDDLTQKPLYQQLWSGEDMEKPGSELNKPSSGLALFLGCNSFVDYEIGRVMEIINQNYPDALVIFTSDHGEMLGNHKLQMKNAACYKEIANVPLIIRGGEAGKTITSPASHIDLVPTILDYMGVPLPKVLEGKSMLPQIYDAEQEINDVVFTEFTRYEVDHDGFGGVQMMRAATSEKYKLVVHLLDSDEFYDLVNDPYETINLIDSPDYEAVRNALHDRMLQQMNETRDPFRGYQWAVRPWRKDKEPSWENDRHTRQRENEEYEPRQLDYDTGLPMEKATRLKETNDVKA
ncbi:hypothetical protein NRIC_20690 [Enterococcus florum]|uniref:Sulfatase N-terminal domain-containing protein n=1 Tax=Enterococcus florum TaxID=2480627 RepID=A0A4P5PDN9_9ENTE|nr:sulfatase-like hydrolase/transferase [Enterococcus florum]GCF94178.1 hypothetical protein NRIC_20690 [Enterococcus florum]